MQQIAFLGLGVMGGGMAARLVNAGFPLTVWNRRPQKTEPLTAAGAIAAATPRDAAASADVIVTMLADDEASRAVWTGPDGALAAVKRGAILIECGTVSPRWIADLASRAEARGCDVLDAPVTGSRSHAASGEVLFLVGGRADVLDRARPVLRPMSRDIVHLGPLGSGARMKLVNNFICGVQAAALAEGLALIEACGLDRDTALAVLTNGAPGSPLVKAVSARMASQDYAVNFMLALMEKDLRYAAAEGDEHGITLSTADVARRLFERAADAGFAEKDFSAVAEVVRPGVRQ